MNAQAAYEYSTAASYSAAEDSAEAEAFEAWRDALSADDLAGYLVDYMGVTHTATGKVKSRLADVATVEIDLWAAFCDWLRETRWPGVADDPVAAEVMERAMERLS